MSHREKLRWKLDNTLQVINLSFSYNAKLVDLKVALFENFIKSQHLLFTLNKV